MKKIIKRELEVAFSRHAQPAWFRVSKYLFLAAAIYAFRGSVLLWLSIAGMMVAGLTLHLWYRYKTNAWTRSYGMWSFEKNKPKS